MLLKSTSQIAKKNINLNLEKYYQNKYRTNYLSTMHAELNKELIEKEYYKYKLKALEAFDNHQYAKSLSFIKFCGLIAWNYPILYNYCDDKLEELMGMIKKEINSSNETKHSENKKRVIFYNSQIIDSGALTEQYLHFFIQNEYQVLFIVPDVKNTLSGKNILQTIHNNSNIQLHIVKAKGDINKIKEVDKIVKEYEAQLAFLHFVPNDIVGYTAFSDHTFLKRYYIVHNDHTFWFGKGCSDFFIEFRKLGYCLSIQRRGIDFKHIYINPFYPIIQKKEFQGFPFNPKGKIIGLSGGNMYKYYLDPHLKYFNVIKELIQKNDDFIFCLAGPGDASIVKNFIHKNKLEDRFFFLGKRNDFYELVKHVDIFFESYPMKGGLTVLYAVENQKAISGIGGNQMISLPIEDFFELNNYRQPNNFSDFTKESDQLIKDKKYRINNAKMFDKSKYKKSLFDAGLKKILEGDCGQIKPYLDEIEFDNEEYLNEYLSLPNAHYMFYYYKFINIKNNLPLQEIIFLYLNLKRIQISKLILKKILS